MTKYTLSTAVNHSSHIYHLYSLCCDGNYWCFIHVY